MSDAGQSKCTYLKIVTLSEGTFIKRTLDSFHKIRRSLGIYRESSFATMFTSEVEWIFRSRAFMKKGSLEVTFLSVRPSVREHCSLGEQTARSPANWSNVKS